jgi:hypothetical protein
MLHCTRNLPLIEAADGKCLVNFDPWADIHM